jgi:cytoskeletal protein RodZ
MLIAILVLLGIAGAIWYFASKQTQTVSLTAEQTAELNRQIERDAALAAAAVEPTSSISSPSVEQIDAALAAAPVVEVPASPVVEPIAPVVEKPSVAVEEAPKPVKKKRRYYPKKK